MGVHDGRWAKVLPICPEDGATRRAGRTQDALCGVIKTCAVFRGLQTFLVRLRRGDEEGLNLAVRLEEGLHVDNEVLFQGQTFDGFDVDRLGDIQILDQRLAGKAVSTVDAHGVGAANAVGTAATEAERAVLVPLDAVKSIEYPVGGIHFDVKVFPVRFSIVFWVKSTDDKRDRERGDFGNLGNCGGRSSHQYFLSIGG